MAGLHHPLGPLMERCSFSSEGGCRGPACAWLLLLQHSRAPSWLGLSFLAARLGCVLHAHPSFAVASGNPSGLKHWFKVLLWLPTPLMPPTTIFPLHTGLPLGIVALVGLLQVRKAPFF